MPSASTDEDRLPTALWVEAHLRRLNAEGVSHYIIQKGAYAGGMVLLKLNGLENGCAVLGQQRDLEGHLGWMRMVGKGQERVEEKEADAYIARAVQRDPDLWVIEIEDRALANPFDGKILI